ncbi:MAG: hypothetical protein P4L83_18155 [Nevskia sp.]|nr:hypothetical protein [Nevskia sp.]
MTGLAVQRLLSVPTSWPPTLVVVVDTEEEFNWSAPFDAASTGVSNIACQHLAQRILDAHGVVPTYVVDYPVAATPAAAATLRAIAGDGRCDIGAHLHPWVNPPAEGPIDARHSYPGNLPPELERRKLAALTQAIMAGFGIRPVVYKAGRYGIGPATAGILRDLGYAIDVSVVPHTDFSADDGPDFRGLPDRPFVIAPGVVELPLSVHFAGALRGAGRYVYPRLAGRLPGVAARLGLLERLRLSPEGHRLDDMLRQTRAALAGGARLFMLTYHSATLLPGATGYVRDEAGRDRFLARLDDYCRAFLGRFGGRASTPAAVAAALEGGA